MAGFVAVVLGLSLLTARNVLTRAAEESAYGRLARAAHEIAATAGASVEARVSNLRQVAASEAVHALLDAPSDPPAAELTQATAALTALNLAARAGLGAELWSVDGRRVAVFSAGRSSVAPWLTAGVLHSPLQRSGDESTAWTVVPVVTGDVLRGYLASELRVGGPQAAMRSISALTGEEVMLYMRNRDGGFWTQHPGGPVDEAPVRAAGYDRAYRLDDGIALASEHAIDGTPWVVVAVTPLSTVHAAVAATLWRLGGVSLLLLVLGSLLAWSFGSRLARPLTLLQRAADAMTGGDYSQRVAVPGADEVGRLAGSFNHLAEQLEHSHSELNHRFEEAQQARAEAERLRNLAEYARDHAERASRAKSDFLAVASHELRTPLNAIGGYTQLLELGIYGALTEQQQAALRRVTTNQTHLMKLIDDILSYAHLEAGRMSVAMADVPIIGVLEAIEPSIAPQIRARGLTFVSRAIEPGTAVRGDATWVKQILLNLLSNAIKFTPVGGTVAIACEATEQNVRVHVRDSGCGIPANRTTEIFEPFVQIDRTHSRPADGIGLGLPISRELARTMGGDITVVSAEGRGSVFTLTLPRAADPRLPVPAPEPGTRG